MTKKSLSAISVSLLAIAAWYIWHVTADPSLPPTTNTSPLNHTSAMSHGTEAESLLAEKDNDHPITDSRKTETLKPASCVMEDKLLRFGEGLAAEIYREKPELGLSEADIRLLLKSLEKLSQKGEVYVPVDEHGVIRLAGAYLGKSVKTLTEEDTRNNGEAALIVGLWLAYFADAENNVQSKNPQEVYERSLIVEDHLLRAYQLGQTSALTSLRSYFEGQSAIAWRLSQSDLDPHFLEVDARAKAYAELDKAHGDINNVFIDWVMNEFSNGAPEIKNQQGETRPPLSSSKIARIEQKKAELSMTINLKPRTTQEHQDFEQLKWMRDQRSFVDIFKVISEKCPQLDERND